MSKKAEKRKNSSGKNSTGRPKKEIDFLMLEQLCAIHCTQSEICSAFRVDHKTLSTRIKEKYGIGFSQFYQEFSDQGKMALRRMQWKSAPSNVSMQKWLGVNILGQKNEPSDNKYENNKGANVTYHIVTNSMKKTEDEN